MAAAAIFAKRSNSYNLIIYHPISPKFEMQAQNGIPVLEDYKPEVQTGNKMAAAAISV